MSAELPQVSKGPDHAPLRHDKVRLVIFLYRKEGMSAEDFSTYWRETHAHVFAGLAIAKKNLLKYEQVHCNREALQTIQDGGFPVADYDGMAIFDAYSVEKLMEVFSDPEYKEKVIPDEENFIQRKKAVAYPGQIVTVFSDPS